MIAIPIAASTEEEAFRDMKRAEQIADCIELRLDRLHRTTWLPLLERRKKPVIVTLRPERQGGAFRGEERQRIRLLEELLVHQPDYVDVENDTSPDLMGSLLENRREKTRVIVSYHNFAETPRNLASFLKRAVPWQGDILKIATLANDLADNGRMLRWLESRSEKTIAFCMGPFGVPSRILTLRSGGYLTFAALDEGKGSAPGQILARDLRETYRAHEVHRGTRVFGLIGNPVSHSLSPHIHNAAFRATGLDAVYIPIPVQNLENLTSELTSLGVEGFSVTMPHKEGMVPLLDSMDEESRRIGAVNTVFRRDGQWVGTNTDVYGAWKALRTTGFDLEGRRWTIIGAGGVARAIVYGVIFRSRAKSLTILGRRSKRVHDFLRDLQAPFPCAVTGTTLAEADLAQVMEGTDVLVNGTPVGMVPDVGKTPIPPECLSPRHLVFDAIYNPVETRLLKMARAKGCPTVPGLPMFLHQGAAQFEHWTGKAAPLERMEEIARARLEP